jgi:glycine/D-amino acid oxidase-like deaminating enzyme
VLRKHLHWFRNSDARYQQDKGAPVFFYELGDRCFYGFPQRDTLGVKVSEHSGGEEIADPAQLSPDLDQADFADVAEFLRQYLPGVSEQASRHDVCMYTMSPDGHFILDTHPEHSNVCFVAGLSGHGFKFACVLGELLADLATGRSLAGPELFSLSRFVSQSD